MVLTPQKKPPRPDLQTFHFLAPTPPTCHIRETSSFSRGDRERLHTQQNKKVFMMNTRRLCIVLGAVLCVMGWPQSRKGWSRSKRCQRGMVWIPGGSFVRGSTRGRLDERPPRKIKLSGYCLDRTEVSMKDYRKCVRAGRCKMPAALPKQYSPQRPMVAVTWHDALTFCRWANKRLPTEAEWERAAKGKRANLRYPVRGKLRCDKANYGALPSYPCRKGHPGIPLKAGRYKGGPFGLQHMAGNVSEWVADCYSPNYYKKSPRTNPQNKRCNPRQSRVLRGGSLSSPPADIRTAARIAAWAYGSFLDVGFRCASSPTK
ncbi:MAG TPA: hypothetical protein DCE42_24210 [Myxococcales bacterium]|nr:hypothetical protein [Deltaproteobacteria bacterium]HAA57891.1 hypothetical protein [Myxococcales bacterium]